MKNIGYVFIVLLLCTYSCQNSYQDWNVFFSKLDQQSKIIQHNKKTTTTFTLELKEYISKGLQPKSINKTSNHQINIRLLQKSKNKRKNQSFEKALTILDSIDLKHEKIDNTTRHIINHEISLEKIRNLLQINKFIEANLLIQKGLQDTKDMNTWSIYYHCNYLLARSKYLQIITKVHETLSTIHYALHLININNYKWKNLSYQLLDTKREVINDEYSIYEETILTLFDVQATLSNSINNQTSLMSDKISFFTQTNQLTKADSLLTKLQTLIPKANNSTKTYAYTSIAYSYAFRSSKDSPLNTTKYLDQANDLMVDTSCVRNFYINKLYKAIILIQQKHFDKALKIVTNVKSRPFCNQNLDKTLKFYTNIVMSMYYNAQPNIKNYRENFINVLINNRILSQELYQGDLEYHLDDYYVINCTDILDHLYKLYPKKIPKKYHKLVLSLLHDTKNKEITRKQQKDNNSLDTDVNLGLNNINKIIIDGLQKTNDFKNFNDYQAIYYKDIYKAFQNKNTIIDKIGGKKPNHIIDTLKYQEIVNQLITSKGQILNFLVNKDKYWIVIFDGIDMYIKHVDLIEMNKLISGLNYSKSLTNQIQLLKKLSFYEDIDLNKELYVFPDGNISIMSFDYMDIITNRMHNLNTITETAKIYLNKKEMGLLSFSDSTTRKTTSEQEVPELYNDFEECKSIKNILKIDSTNFFHGGNANFDNLKTICINELLHISSHSYSDNKNRLKGYFYLRDSLSIPKKHYLSDLYNIEKSPKFVCLSTCESGLGTHVIGQGVYSLSRPFFQKGTKTILKSIWKINDIATKEFMISFYTFWNSGLSVKQALIKTKTSFKNSKNYKDSYYWAGFVLEGNPNLYLK